MIPIPFEMVVSGAAKLGLILVSKVLGDEIPEMIGNRLSKLFGFDPKVSIWDHDRNPSLIWRLPDKESPKKDERKMKDLDGIMIRNNEVAIYRAGANEQPLIPGVWKIERKARERRGAELVFVQYSTFAIKWGIPRNSGPMTKDGIQIGLSGEVRVRVSNAIKFVNEIVKNRDEMTADDVKKWIFGDVIAILRDQIQRMDAATLTSQSLSMAVQAKGELELPKYGITITRLNVMYTALPEEFVSAKTRYGVSKVDAESMKVMGKAKSEVDSGHMANKASYAERLMQKSKETGVGMKLSRDGDIEVGTNSSSDQSFCHQCGEKIGVSKAKFCPSCGEKIR